MITTTGMFDPAVLRAAIDTLGCGAMMFFADYPCESLHDSVELIRQTPMTDEQHHKVAHGHAERVPKLTPGPHDDSQ